MKLWTVKIALLAALGFSAFCPPASAGQTSVAVAANFTEPAKRIAALFKQTTGHEAVLSFGATGALYAQITQDAPFQIMLAANRESPEKAAKEGFAVADSRFTYAIGKLVLWSRAADLVIGEQTLKGGAFAKVSIADPAAAPYGTAAIETLKALGVYEALKDRIVQGASIAQAFQFIDTGNAELGFVALSQLTGNASGSRWLVPQSLYTPIAQDAVLLKKGVGNDAATSFMAFLKGPEARGVIESFGYAFEADH